MQRKLSPTHRGPARPRAAAALTAPCAAGSSSEAETAGTGAESRTCLAAVGAAR